MRKRKKVDRTVKCQKCRNLNHIEKAVRIVDLPGVRGRVGLCERHYRECCKVNQDWVSLPKIENFARQLAYEVVSPTIIEHYAKEDLTPNG